MSLINTIRDFFYTRRVNCYEKVVFLTFDDGPEPDITEYVLALLSQYDIKATFFCCGYNIERHKDLYYKIVDAGHLIASHTMSHLRGADTPLIKYVKDISQFRGKYHTNILRPPYGSLTRMQKFILPFLGYKVVTWSDDSTDWYDSEEIDINDIESFIDGVGCGSVVLFHFCNKHAARTRKILPCFLKQITDKGYSFETLKRL